MEIMLEIYRTLRILGMEWKEKRTLGGLGGKKTPSEREAFRIERRSEMDGQSFHAPEFDQRAAAGIYFIETRARKDNIVVCSLLS